jgi:hypothetical protein
MKKCQSTIILASIVLLALLAMDLRPEEHAFADENQVNPPTKRAIDRSRKTIAMLDNIYKNAIVLITDKYVHDEDDFAAGSAAVLLFKNVSASGSHHVRLIDATGEPYDSENVAQDDFEKEAIRRLKAGAKQHEQVVTGKDEHLLRVVTPVPVVMPKCVMCHAHYADAKEGEPIGAISYTIAIE